MKILGILSSRIIKICANIKLNEVVYIKLQNKSFYQFFLLMYINIKHFCTFTRVKLKKQYFYWRNILLYISVILLLELNQNYYGISIITVLLKCAGDKKYKKSTDT